MSQQAVCAEDAVVVRGHGVGCGVPARIEDGAHAVALLAAEAVPLFVPQLGLQAYVDGLEDVEHSHAVLVVCCDGPLFGEEAAGDVEFWEGRERSVLRELERGEGDAEGGDVLHSEGGRLTEVPEDGAAVAEYDVVLGVGEERMKG